MSIHIKSEGCEDPGIPEGTCGLAYIYVNGEDKSPHSRGHNVVVVDAVTGNVTLVANTQLKRGYAVYKKYSTWSYSDKRRKYMLVVLLKALGIIQLKLSTLKRGLPKERPMENLKEMNAMSSI